MKVYDVSQRPTSITRDWFKDKLVPVSIHESCLRAYQILGNVKEYLRKNTPPEVILELIDLMENPPKKDNE